MSVLICDLDNTLNRAWRRIFECTKKGLDPYTASQLYHDRTITYAKTALKTFRKQGWEILILTARLSIKDGEKITKRWLSTYDLVYDKLCLVQCLEDKIGFLHRVPCDLFIDDLMSGQENKIPDFRWDVYEQLIDMGIQVEVFRNNWLEICYRHLNVWL